ncbi:MAG: SDR family oxidoreductase [Alphaproteobacteria bacterium]|nr:SDR family oxidoreductase [Alphaproteobacteria bacterium]
MTAYPDVKGRVAVVTGAARGLGLAIAKRLLHGGASVWLWDVDEAALAEAKAGLGGLGTVSSFALDISDEAQVARGAGLAVAQSGRVDILVNNAGITGGNATVWDMAPATWRKVIEINLTGAFLTCHALVPLMLKGGYGRIVNIASVAGKEGNPNAAHYSASKAGLIGLTKSLAKELAQKNILVNCVTPAAANTPILAQMTQQHIDYMLAKIPMGRLLEAEEVAAMVAWLCSEECSFSTGAVFDISGGRATY